MSDVVGVNASAVVQGAEAFVEVVTTNIFSIRF